MQKRKTNLLAINSRHFIEIPSFFDVSYIENFIALIFTALPFRMCIRTSKKQVDTCLFVATIAFCPSLSTRRAEIKLKKEFVFVFCAAHYDKSREKRYLPLIFLNCAHNQQQPVPLSIPTSLLQR
jgi:hypothetical protein